MIASLPATPPPPRFLAADVGGTHARIATVSAADTGGLVLSGYRTLACADHPSLGDLLGRYREQAPTPVPDTLVLACPGYRDGDALVHANLPWPVALSDVRARSGMACLELVNDFAAVAHAAGDPAGMSETVVHPGRGHLDASHPILVLGPGTGLGAALCVQVDGRLHVIGTEAGQATFAPGSMMEAEVVGVLRQQYAHVSREHLLSGPGLVNIHAALCVLAGVRPRLRQPAEVTAAARGGADPQAAQALRIFCEALGGTVADMVLSTGAIGGVRLAGGVPAHIRDCLLDGGFNARFVAKGAMREQLAQVPVHLIEHGQLGVIGAAHWFLAQRRTHQQRGCRREGAGALLESTGGKHA